MPPSGRPTFIPRRRALLQALAGGMALAAMPARAAPRLRVLAWPGYADADLVAAFERRHKLRVELSLVDSDDALWSRLTAQGGPAFDVVAANTAEIGRMVERDLLRPLARERLPGLARQLPRFRSLSAIPGLTRSGALYGVPYAHAEMGLIYDRAWVDEPPKSIQSMWDPRLRGRVLAYNGSVHNFSVAALSLGLPPFDIPGADMPRVVERLIALRRNVRAFYTLPEESLALFRDGGARLLFANYGKQQLAELRRAGLDVGYVVPEEGALAWLDCWAVTRAAAEPALAEAWIDHMLQEDAARALSERHGLANTLFESGEAEPGRLYWTEPVENAELRQRLWRHIVAGDRPQRFHDDATLFGSRP